MFSGSNTMIVGGTFNYQNRTSKGMDILMEWVATGAFHNSDELCDAPKCHPHTRVAVLDNIMKWVSESESASDDFMLWLFGPAGAGKSAIAKRIAELAAERDLLLGDFFFSRTSPTRGTKDRLIATLAYQLTVSIPDTRSYIEDAIERDPAIFKKNVLTQINTLLVKPFQSILSTQIVPSQKLIIIDGLDECNDTQAQVAILGAISLSFPQHNLPIKFLLVSRPEPDIVAAFNCNNSLKSIHHRLALDDTYQPDSDIHLFFSDKFQQIKHAHPLRSTIPISWPTEEVLDTLVRKSSGQFVYASTVVKFVEASCHRPSTRLNIILGISPPGTLKPFAELDALYSHLLSSVNDMQLTLRVLSLYVMTPNFAYSFEYDNSMTPELFLSLEPGDIQLALINLSSILTYDESSGAVKVLHASLVDFLSDKSRSNIFYIDTASTCTDFTRRIFQYVEVPDGIRAGDVFLFRHVIKLSPWIPRGQLRSNILNFDLDAFINASRVRYYKPYKRFVRPDPRSTLEIYNIWTTFLDEVNLEDGDKKEALDRLNKSFESRLQIYQSDWRLHLLRAFAAANLWYSEHYGVPYCRCVDILLGMMDNHNLHLVDQDALNLRHAFSIPVPILIPRYVDGDAYASGALHCMHFLSNPPKYSKRTECPEMGLMYAEWKQTCQMTLGMLRLLLQEANTVPELVQFISNHDIHPEVKKKFSANSVWEVNLYILAFLSRASVCVYWRIVSAILIQRSLQVVTNDWPYNLPWKIEQDKVRTLDENERPDESENLETTLHLIQQRTDQCCWDMKMNHYSNATSFRYSSTPSAGLLPC